MKLLAILFCFSLNVLAIQGGLPLPKEWNGRSAVVRISSGERGTSVANCSGIMLTSKVILTAAHCFSEYGMIRKLTIENLETNVRHVSTFKTISKPGYNTRFHDHPEFQKTGYDIGLIILRWEVPFRLPAFELAKEERDLNISIPDIWLIANGSQKPFYDRSSAAIPIFEIVKHSFTGNENFYQYKAAIGKAGPCEGDSGGGIFSWKEGVWTLEGIQSTKRAAPDCDADLNRGYFVPIYSNREWILSILKGNG